MIQDETSSLVVDVARDIVMGVAPDELPIFDVSSEEYLAQRGRARATDQDQMLGFGGGVELEFLTPVILTVSSGVITFLMDAVLNATKAEARTIVEQRARLLFKRFRAEAPPDSSAPPPLTHAQLEQVRQVALDLATRMSVPAPQAGLLADAAVGQLALAD